MNPKSQIEYRIDQMLDNQKLIYAPQNLQNSIDESNNVVGSNGNFMPFGGTSQINNLNDPLYNHGWLQAQYKMLNGQLIDDTNFPLSMLPDSLVVDLQDSPQINVDLSLAFAHNAIITQEKLATKFTFSYMNLQGLQLVWGLMQRQKNLENGAAYWEETKTTCLLDTSIVSGQRIRDNGVTSHVWEVEHTITADEALTVVTAKRLLTRGK